MLQTWRKFDFEAVIIDEAHRVSSEKGELSKCVERLRRKSTIMLTGTPIQSEVNQLVRLFKICDKRIFRDMFLQKEDIFQESALTNAFQKVSIFLKALIRNTSCCYCSDRWKNVTSSHKRISQ